MKTASGIADLRLVEYPRRGDSTGELVVFDEPVMPFPIARVFVVRAGVGAERGRHAHRLCSQLMVCLNGRCEVACKDGSTTLMYLLDRADRGLLVPPGIWAEQRYLDSGTVLMVLCDRPYEEHEYIRNYEDFLAFRKVATFSP